MHRFQMFRDRIDCPAIYKWLIRFEYRPEIPDKMHEAAWGCLPLPFFKDLQALSREGQFLQLFSGQFSLLWSTNYGTRIITQ